MPLWKQLLLTLYYHATRPVRAWDYRQEASRGRVPAMVLYYHRIADDRANPWTVSNGMFVRQIDWLRERFDLVSLDDAQRRIRSGSNQRPSISITFDDGYADNCRHAIPWLVKERIPCTYFITLQNILDEEPFLHDLVMGRPLAPNTLEQVRAMAAAGVEIGAHAYTHNDLGPITNLRLLCYEMVTAREDLQAAVGRPVRYFAFPFGQHVNMNAAAFALAKEVGYAGVCSAYGGYNFPGDDPFHLQRIPVDDDMIRLKNWVTMDRRKLRTERFIYEEMGALDSGLGIRSTPEQPTGTSTRLQDWSPTPPTPSPESPAPSS